MNKSLLIVICDFLVSAMLTMMTGMVPAHSGGTGVGLDENTTKLLLAELDAHRVELEKLRSNLRQAMEKSIADPKMEAELLRLTKQLAQNKIQRDKLISKLNATPYNTGKIDEKELKKRLEEEKTKLAMMEIQLKDKSSDLSHTREKLSDAKNQIKLNARDLAASQRDLAKTRDALAKTSEALVDMTRTHVDTQRKLAKAESEVEAGKNELQRRNEEIKQKTAELRISAARLSSAQGENKAIQSKLAYTTGQLRVRERDYAGLQDKLARAEGELMVEKLSAAEMRARSEELGKTLKTAVSQLSATTAELNKVSKDKAIAETKLAGVKDITEKLLKAASRRHSDVIASYADSVVNFNCKVSEEKLFGLHSGTGNFFFPIVRFNNKNFVIGTLNKFAGDADTALAFIKVKELLFHVQSPGSTAAKRRIASPMLTNAADTRAAAFEYPHSDRKPLPLLTSAELKKRGTDGLYLFKCTSLGKESTLLDGRCSLSLVPGENFMFIRNAGRANNELNADPGDFIISREGEFAGVVIGYETADNRKVKISKVLLFADTKAWDNAKIIHIDRKQGTAYYEDFAKNMREIRKTLPADSRRR